jgi:hypothetical protein
MRDFFAARLLALERRMLRTPVPPWAKLCRPWRGLKPQGRRVFFNAGLKPGATTKPEGNRKAKSRFLEGQTHP